MSYSIYNKLAFVLFLILNPSFLLLAFRKKVYLPTYIQFSWAKKLQIKTLIDIGAHKGHVSHAFKIYNARASVYAFDPLLNHEVNQKKLGRKATLENLALSNKKGQSTFFVHNNSVLSSLLTLNQSEKKYTKDIQRTTKVDVTTLDHYFKSKNLKGPIFLKVDTQGNEYEVLLGGRNLLKIVDIIHIEVSFESFYTNQKLFGDIYNLLTKSGFEYVGQDNDTRFFPFFGLDNQVNCIFTKPYFKKKVLTNAF